MKDLEIKKAEYAKLLESAQTENRGLTVDETKRADILKGEIQLLERAEKEKQDAVAAAMQTRDEHLRSIAAAQSMIKENANKLDKNTYLRSIAKGTSDVGNKEVIADVVRQFEAQSPIFAAHKNVQNRSTGNAFSYTKVTKGSTAAGYVKTEGNAGTADGDSTVTVESVTFKSYDGQQIVVTQEMLDDAAADVAAEVIGLGSAKATMKFDTDAVTELAGAFTSIPETAATSWAVSDLIDAYLEIPNRNRYGVSYICRGATAAKLLALLTTDNAPALAAIGFGKESLTIDENVAADTLIVGNVTLALAIGMKQPVRVWTDETSAGRVYEVQPRLACKLRDATALAGRTRKTA